ncbi:hypothetical protein Pdw03_2504 [Penicillium digitatum]|uniref:Uncharacterized protein n=3 Tax=Penicillium digitatum TaxID=36651 RepID=K9GDH9_PEND2|nr:hypothetical protein PDIP_20730 [Penicillium digitatum Pd1]EKV11316.1 hypothetical protein PDIG_51530 [Penicillium digitatum PHI26]EKV19916.1 hypothetical protein PDIP_20730 [Penicillium digitatum Pd1]KAG0153275.1 hypothetical protein PDIDSM_5125 [Penicillium digitatum]QQK39650.1 hypothetical protein Pdw03_2504 [Penicillium digitatum]
MFYQNGRLIQDPEDNPRTTNWVNIFFNARDYRCDDLAIMRTVITCIRTRVVSITGHAMHYDIPLCISIPVPGEQGEKESILAAAELSAEILRVQVARGSVYLNRSLLFRR